MTEKVRLRSGLFCEPRRTLKGFRRFPNKPLDSLTGWAHTVHMTTRYATKHSRNGNLWSDHFNPRNPEPFRTNGSLDGVDYRTDTDQLDDANAARYKADDPTFTIRSYSTPIAWRKGDGTWVMVAQKFSATTTTHQTRCRTALNYTYETV